MATTPEEILNKKFAVTLRGYDAREVDAFLKDIAGLYRDALTAAQAKPAASASFDELGKEVGSILKTATDTANDIREKARTEAARVQQEATETAAGLRTSTEEETAAAREKAAQEGDRILNAARSEAERIATEARHKRSEMLDAAVQRHEDLKKHEQELRARIEAVEVVFRELRSEMEANQPVDASADDGTSSEVVDLTSGSRSRPAWNATDVQPRPVPRPPSGSKSPSGAGK